MSNWTGHPDQYHAGLFDGQDDARLGIDARVEVYESCEDDPETCDYCRGYGDGQATVPLDGECRGAQ